MPTVRRKRIHVSPLFVRFAAQRVSKGHTIAEINGTGVEYWLHATKGWRRRSWRVEERDEMYTEEDE